jgi:hypothetical protein
MMAAVTSFLMYRLPSWARADHDVGFDGRAARYYSTSTVASESFSGSCGRMMLRDPIVIARSGQGPLLVAFKLLIGICVRLLR